MAAFAYGSDTRLPRLVEYLSHFYQWELEELACVYDFLEMAVFQYDEDMPPSGFMVEVDPHGAVIFQDCKKKVPTIKGHHAGSLLGRSSSTCKVGLFAALGQESPSVFTYKASTRARLLSGGLVFLRSFHQQPLLARQRTEWRLIGCSLGDEFIQAALHSPLALDGYSARPTEPRLFDPVTGGVPTVETLRQDFLNHYFATNSRVNPQLWQDRLRLRSWGYANTRPCRKLARCINPLYGMMFLNGPTGITMEHFAGVTFAPILHGVSIHITHSIN